jgi:hypothetical protein
MQGGLATATHQEHFELHALVEPIVRCSVVHGRQTQIVHDMQNAQRRARARIGSQRRSDDRNEEKRFAFDIPAQHRVSSNDADKERAARSKPGTTNAMAQSGQAARQKRQTKKASGKIKRKGSEFVVDYRRADRACRRAARSDSRRQQPEQRTNAQTHSEWSERGMTAVIALEKRKLTEQTADGNRRCREHSSSAARPKKGNRST